MAEIRIEKKKPVWPWILLIIIILGVVFYFWYVGNEQDEIDDLEDTTEEVEDNTYSAVLPVDNTVFIADMDYVNSKIKTG